MTEKELYAALDLARMYLRGEQIANDGVEQICEALIALDADLLDDFDEEEPTGEIATPAEQYAARLDKAINARVHEVAEAFCGRGTVVEEETFFPEDGWPPWSTSYKLDGDIWNFHLNQKMISCDQKPGFFRDLWRWLTGKTWRVIDIRNGVVTVERG